MKTTAGLHRTENLVSRLVISSDGVFMYKKTGSKFQSKKQNIMDRSFFLDYNRWASKTRFIYLRISFNTAFENKIYWILSSGLTKDIFLSFFIRLLLAIYQKP